MSTEKPDIPTPVESTSHQASESGDATDEHVPGLPATSAGGNRAGGHQGFARTAARILGADDDLPIDPDLLSDDPGAPSRDHRASGIHVRRANPGVLAAIAAGGFIGTLGRYELSLAWPTPEGHFPSATFVINTSGAFLIGLVLTVIVERIGPTRYLRPFAAVGVLGGWTTMSTLAVEADTLVKGGHLALAAGYLAATMIASVAASVAGIALGRTNRKRTLAERPS